MYYIHNLLNFIMALVRKLVDFKGKVNGLQKANIS